MPSPLKAVLAFLRDEALLALPLLQQILLVVLFSWIINRVSLLVELDRITRFTLEVVIYLALLHAAWRYVRLRLQH